MISLRFGLSRGAVLQVITPKAFVWGPLVTEVLRHTVGGHVDRAQSGLYCGGTSS